MSYEDKVIADLATFKLDGLDADSSIHPALLDIVRHIAKIAADADWKSFVETGVIPYSEPD